MAELLDDAAEHSALASYIATITADLATMSRRSGLDTLGYLLEMVRLEAESVARQGNGQRARRG
jgi:hypothetical protein